MNLLKLQQTIPVARHSNYITPDASEYHTSFLNQEWGYGGACIWNIVLKASATLSGRVKKCVFNTTRSEIKYKPDYPLYFFKLY